MRIEEIKSSTVLNTGQQVVVLKCSKFCSGTAFFQLQQGIGTGAVQFYRHREEPVPGIRRVKHGRLFGRPRTTNERRAHFSNEATEEILESHGVAFKVRRKRSPHMLPTAWNDISRLHQRTWKENRRTQRKNADGIDRRMHSRPYWDWKGPSNVDINRGVSVASLGPSLGKMPPFKRKGISPGDNYFSAQWREILSYCSLTLILD